MSHSSHDAHTSHNSTSSILRIILTAVMFGLLVVGGIFLFAYASQNKGIVAGIKDTVIKEEDSTSPIARQIEKERTIVVTSEGFTPTEQTVKAYEKVTWQNQTDSSIYVEHYPENEQGRYLPFTLGETMLNESVSTFFMYKGSYRYWDRYHPNRIGFLKVE